MVALSSQTYILDDPSLTWSITGSLVTTQVPACGYSQILTSTTHPAFVLAISGATITFSAFSRNFLDAGSHPIIVTSTLDSLPTTFTQSNFDLIVLNPCDSTLISMVPSSIENFVSFAGFSS